MELEYKTVGVSGLKVLDPENGIIETFVSVTGLQDNVKDVIHAGAYEKSLATRIPKGVWHHNWHETISRTEDIKELQPGDSLLPKMLPNGQPWPVEAGALLVKTRFNLATQRGREAYEDVKFFGDQQEWSIGYNVPVGGSTLDSKTGVRHIQALELYEYSPVLFGAMPAARTASVKEAQLAYKSLNTDDFNTFMVETKTFLEDLEEKRKKMPPADVAGPDDAKPNMPVKPGDPEDAMDGGKDEMMEDENGKMVPKKPKMKPDMMKKKSDDFFEDDDDDDTDFVGGVSAAQYATIASAIKVLSDILELKADDLPSASDDDTLFTHVSQLFPDDTNLHSDAQNFDDAMDAGNQKAMEEAGSPIMDAIEEAIEGGDDASKYADITSYLRDAFDEQDDDTETEVDESLGSDASASKGDDNDDMETKTINIEEFMRDFV